MNNHKVSKWIQILLCTLPLFVPSWSSITPYDQVNVTIFDRRDSVFQSEVLRSLQTTENLFARKEFADGAMVGLLAVLVNPEWRAMTSVMRVLQALLGEESDWTVAFTKTVPNEARREIVLNNVHLMEESIMIFQEQTELLSENNTNMENRKSVASIIHTEIQRMSYFFDSSHSLFKTYPLIGSPPLIALALFVTVFEPIAQTLIPLEANTPKLSCEIRNILLDYRPRAVYARLEKLRFLYIINNLDKRSTLSKIIFETMSTQYNQYGYNTTILATISCLKGCEAEASISSPEYPKYKACVEDDFGGKYTGNIACPTEYALLLRHRVEKLFPIELLNKVCKNQPETTGFGWFTIHLRNLCAPSSSDLNTCGNTEGVCDPFVRLFIDGALLLETKLQENTNCYYDEWVTSNRISKSALVKVEIFGTDPLAVFEYFILGREGNIDSFLKTGHRVVAFSHNTKDLRSEYVENLIDTFSFWQDEYKYMN